MIALQVPVSGKRGKERRRLAVPAAGWSLFWWKLCSNGAASDIIFSGHFPRRLSGRLGVSRRPDPDPANADFSRHIPHVTVFKYLYYIIMFHRKS